jgi:signal transduction histidine kinase
MNQFFKRLLSTIPFLIISPFLLLIIYSSLLDYQLPHDGMDWDRISGLVQSVLPEGPSSGLIEPGDLILAINDIPVVQSSQSYQGMRVGDDLSFSIKRGDEQFEATIELSNAPIQIRIQRLTPHFVALIFVLIGSLIRAYSRITLVANLFFLLCLLASGALSSGSISATGPAWASKFFNILVWWIGPATVHLHLHFPQDAPRKLTYILHPVLYLIAIIGSSPHIFLKTSSLLNHPWAQTLLSLGRLALSLNLVIAVGLLISSYLRPKHADTRHKIRLITLYGAIAFLLVTSLTLVPSALIFSPILPYEYSLLPLILVPLSYSYTIFRYRLIDLEQHVRRAAGYALVFILLATLLVGFLASIKALLPLSPGNQIVVIVVLTLIFSASFEPLRKRLQKFVDFFFYGGWYDYQSAVEKLTGGLANFNDQALLGSEITRRLKEILKPEYALLLLFTIENGMMVYPENLDEVPPNVANQLKSIRRLKIPIHGTLFQHLYQHREDLNVASLEDDFSDQGSSASEQELAKFLDGKLHIPITNKNTIVGIFLLGPKIGGETFTGEDLNILAIVARQIGISIQNVTLLDEIRRRAVEVDKLHQEIVRAREEEQKRLARELHDEIIQALVGLNYRLSHLDAAGPDRAKEEVRAIIQNMRRITTELRPPGLDNLGLVSAIRSSARRASSNIDQSLEIFLSIKGDEEQVISENVATVLYRVFAEAFNNSLNHAHAKRVEVLLDIQPEEVHLDVRDDGIGFEVPDRLGSFLEKHHFGLVGIRERVDLVNGTFNLISEVGKGTSLQVSVPTLIVENADALERNVY